MESSLSINSILDDAFAIHQCANHRLSIGFSLIATCPEFLNNLRRILHRRQNCQKTNLEGGGGPPPGGGPHPVPPPPTYDALVGARPPAAGSIGALWVSTGGTDEEVLEIFDHAAAVIADGASGATTAALPAPTLASSTPATIPDPGSDTCTSTGSSSTGLQPPEPEPGTICHDRRSRYKSTGSVVQKCHMRVMRA